MEAKKFRIRNLVYNESNEPCLISQLLSDKKIRYEGYEGEDWQFEHTGEDENIYLSRVINPIPITKEWLVKFGFNKGEESYLWERTGNGFTIEFETGNGVVNCYLERVGLDVVYVHELQNLFFALTGTELELKNES